VGGTQAVRLRVEGLGAPGEAEMQRFGRVHCEDGWYVVEGLPTEEVPALVAALVRLGGRVYTVEPQHRTLEERFLELLRAEEVP
jgi:hypothetical protein